MIVLELSINYYKFYIMNLILYLSNLLIKLLDLVNTISKLLYLKIKSQFN